LCLVSRWIFLQRSINKVAQFIRNVPLLLQLLFWYSLFTDIFPGVREAWHMGDWIYLCNRGIYFAHSQESVLLQILFAGVMTALLTGLFFHHRSLQNFARSGNYNVWWHYCLISAIFSTIIILGLNSWSLHWQWPELEGFNFSHGYHLTPEFSSLLLGLVLYTSCFMADIVRSAIQSVDKGQREAASSLGMNSAQIMFLVVLPQSLRVMIPPLVGQILNLTKNSTLAVAIAYPDFVSVANTTLNQTGQAVELMLLIMGVYLCFSLITSLLMNYYNRRFALRGGV
jgi:general L-amino acid transport system permease protein